MVITMWSSGSAGSAVFFFFQAEDGIRYLVRSRGLGDVYKRQPMFNIEKSANEFVCCLATIFE